MKKMFLFYVLGSGEVFRGKCKILTDEFKSIHGHILRSRPAMDRAAISDQIEKILRSPSFASKSQLRKLLEVLWQNYDPQATLEATTE